jgi:tetratricopeptide (TPR) repeat protein
MKSSFAIKLLAATLMLPAICFTARAIEPAQMPVFSEPTPQSTLTPAEIKIGAARKMIAEQPDKAQHYNDLALALARRARETANPKFYIESETVLTKSLEVEPNNFTARKLHVWLMLGKHDFARALEEATKLNKEAPDDILVYGYLADASIELGNYESAEKAAQWMLDMRPGNIPGLTRAAYLRELYGDIEGALDFMIKSYERTPWQEKEDRSWLLTHIAHLEMTRGRLEAADSILAAAFDEYPDYHYAFAQLGKLRVAQGRYAEAAQTFGKLVAVAPNPENYYPLAEALQVAGKSDHAAATFAEFEKKALVELEQTDNSNRELIFYYADHAGKPAAALRIARKEATRRQDAFTLDALAWALYSSGELEEARTQIERAMQVGLRDGKVHYHAGMIYSKLGESELARKHLTIASEAEGKQEVTSAQLGPKAIANVSNQPD